MNVALVRFAISLACALLACASSAFIDAYAVAMVGGAKPAGEAGRAVVLMVGSRGTVCSAVALARDLVLTAGHCVLPGADYKLVDLDDPRAPKLQDTATIAR